MESWKRMVRAVGAVALLVVLAGCRSGTLVKQYEYEEDMYLAVDGSATIYVNASIPALVNLRGFDLKTSPTARLDRNVIRALYTTSVTHVVRVSTWRRFGRRFVQVRLQVTNVATLGSAAPFAWSTYEFGNRDAGLVYRQVVGRAANKPAGDAGWTGRELVAFRLHLPSRIRYHNAGPDNPKRGNILVWEQRLTERQAGVPLEMEARMDRESILYSTLLLFAMSGTLALLLLAAIIWWVVRKGRPSDHSA
jgi:hypothetical protein